MILISAAIVLAFPFYVTFSSALKTTDEIWSRQFVFWPSNPRWENFPGIFIWFEHPTLVKAFLNSTIITVGATLLMLLCSSLTAFVLGVYKFRGNSTTFKLVLTTMMFPAFIGLLPGYMIMVAFGWINTYWALIIPSAISAYHVFLLRQYMITIPDELFEAARMDGCSEFGLYWRIVLPLSKPALAAVGLIASVFTWNDLLWPIMVLQAEDMKTIQQVIQMQMRSFSGVSVELGRMAALMTIAVLPLIIFALITQKHLIKGFTGLSYAKR